MEPTPHPSPPSPPLSLRPLSEHFGAEVVGVDPFASPPDAALLEAIEAALQEHELLLFRCAAPVDNTRQLAFSLRFGDLEHTTRPGANDQRWREPGAFGREAERLAVFANLEPSTGELEPTPAVRPCYPPHSPSLRPHFHLA